MKTATNQGFSFSWVFAGTKFPNKKKRRIHNFYLFMRDYIDIIDDILKLEYG